MKMKYTYAQLSAMHGKFVDAERTAARIERSVSQEYDRAEEQWMWLESKDHMTEKQREQHKALEKYMDMLEKFDFENLGEH